jgi:hypothetical protein
VFPIRTPLPFECDDCKKPLGKGTVISPHDGRVFCDNICAARDYIRLKLGDEPHLVPNDIPLRLLPNRRP